MKKFKKGVIEWSSGFYDSGYENEKFILLFLFL